MVVVPFLDSLPQCADNSLFSGSVSQHLWIFLCVKLFCNRAPKFLHCCGFHLCLEEDSKEFEGGKVWNGMLRCWCINTSMDMGLDELREL